MVLDTVALLLIALLSVIQSVFGVGILLFGTPLFIGLGYSFSETLWLLLPASLGVSVAQVASARAQLGKTLRLVWPAFPMVVIGIIFQSLFGIELATRAMVAGVLLFTALLQVSNLRRMTLERSKFSRGRWWLILIGILHGLTNLGGGLLSAFASSRFAHKVEAREFISSTYGFFAIAQIVTLIAVGTMPDGPTPLISPAISITIFWLLGRGIFAIASNQLFFRLLPLLTLASAIFALLDFSR